MAPGTPVQDSAVWYWSIRPLKEFLFKIHCSVAVSTCFTPGLKLVLGTLPQARQRLRLGRLRKLHGRKSRRAEQRIHERAILCTEAIDFTFHHPNLSRLNYLPHPTQHPPPT